MLDTIKPNSKITIKIVKRPTNDAAAKTLRRLLGKDVNIRKENDRLKRVRKTHFRQAPRGGRFWDIHMITHRAAHGELGEQGTIMASRDVITDLKSVERFIQITPA